MVTATAGTYIGAEVEETALRASMRRWEGDIFGENMLKMLIKFAREVMIGIWPKRKEKGKKEKKEKKESKQRNAGIGLSQVALAS